MLNLGTALALVLFAVEAAAQIPVGQLYNPACNGVQPPSPNNPSLWSPWSSPSTWGGTVPTGGNILPLATTWGLISDGAGYKALLN